MQLQGLMLCRLWRVVRCRGRNIKWVVVLLHHQQQHHHQQQKWQQQQARVSLLQE
jgi:hypothetical protein